MRADNAKIQYESGQTLVPFTALTNTGDDQTFESADSLWSNRGGYAPVIRPNGLATGGIVTPSAGDSVAVSAATCYLAGVQVSVAPEAAAAITRPDGSPHTHQISSVTIDNTGSVAIVAGDPGDSGFSNDRGAAGGPPWIPTGSIEIAQVWLIDSGIAVGDDNIRQVVGTHCERYDYPTWTTERFKVFNGIIGNAGIIFDAVLPAIHSDDDGVATATKAVYAEYYEPEFTDIIKSADFVPPETSHSVTSTQIYGMTIGSSSETLNQGRFTAYLEDGISDGLLRLKNDELFMRFYQNRLNSLPYILCQGKLGVTRSFPATDQITAACTVSSERPGAEVLG